MSKSESIARYNLIINKLSLIYDFSINSKILTIAKVSKLQ
jgi:hypothetical protein